MNVKDQKLHASFLELGEFILNILDKKTDNNIKELFPELSESRISKILKKHWNTILGSTQYKNFESLLVNNVNYDKNFKNSVGTIDAQYKMKVDFFVENIILHYLKNYNIICNKELLNKYYFDIEKFLIDDIVIVTVTTPIFGLKMNNNVLKIEDGMIITHIDKQRKLHIDCGLESLKYAVAHYDFILQFPTKKIFQNSPEYSQQKSDVQKSKIIIQNVMMVLRLHKSGRIGFLDSMLSLSIYAGTQHWQNPRCNLPSDWQSWTQPTYFLNGKDLQEIIKLREEIMPLINKTSTKFLFRSIDRFMISHEQDRIEDRILDLVISLESLLQNEINELKYKLSIRTAKFLGKTPEERNK
ncbi:MAG: hypothetical protein ACRD8K_12320, partial [Nitrososphaeraceae archaeon]